MVLIRTFIEIVFDYIFYLLYAQVPLYNQSTFGIYQPGTYEQGFFNIMPEQFIWIVSYFNQ